MIPLLVVVVGALLVIIADRLLRQGNPPEHYRIAIGTCYFLGGGCVHYALSTAVQFFKG